MRRNTSVIALICASNSASLALTGGKKLNQNTLINGLIKKIVCTLLCKNPPKKTWINYKKRTQR